MNVYARRRMVNGVVMTLSVVATAFGVLWLILVLWTLLENGIAAITPAIFSQMTPPPGSAGGLLNAIFGSLVMTMIATLIGAPTGILAGTFLAEYSRGSRFGEVVRFINDILLSAPSIIVGLFVYELMVVPHGALLGLGRGCRARHYRGPGGRTDHRGHAQPGPELAARSGCRHSARQSGK